MNYESREEWLAKGRELFGKDMLKWRFKCPRCGRVQTPEDFHKFKEKGAQPDTAYQECMGRHDLAVKCDWAAFGLFKGPDFVCVADGEIAVFKFAV